MPAPSSRARRTKHKPRCPGRILQKRGHRPHSIRPSSSFVQYSTSTQNSDSTSIAPPTLARPLLGSLNNVVLAEPKCNVPPGVGASRPFRILLRIDRVNLGNTLGLVSHENIS